jgi:F-type H+-transporting ATPase subunit alpha
LPIAGSVEGDLTGYIQTNLMSITDGHCFFDSALYNEGKRPAVNPFLSVTRVGRQTQHPIVRQMGGDVTAFLMDLKRIRGLMHFGAELTEEVQLRLSLGDKIEEFFYQYREGVISVKLTVFVVGALWNGWQRGEKFGDYVVSLGEILKRYRQDKAFFNYVNDLFDSSKTYEVYMKTMRNNLSVIEGKNG